jgi:hypothetical protein
MAFFCRSQESIKEATTLSSHCQRKIRKKLKEKGILEEKKQGLPRKVYYKIRKKNYEI